jgi:hypothetical protein
MERPNAAVAQHIIDRHARELGAEHDYGQGDDGDGEGWSEDDDE